MPRRRTSPPTALRLVSGPTPPRGAPRHFLPRMPSPAFHPELIKLLDAEERGKKPTVALRVRDKDASDDLPLVYDEPTVRFYPDSLLLGGGRKHGRNASVTSLSSIDSDISSISSTSSVPNSNSTYEPVQVKAPTLRGPWDHSGSIVVEIDVDTVLPSLTKTVKA